MENPRQILVTGGSGFLSGHLLVALLRRGYTVRTTLRSLNKKDDIISMLKANGITSSDKLSFIETSLTSDHNWGQAMEGCSHVLSVAAPVFLSGKEAGDQISEAKEGIIRVLKAARDHGVSRVVMTSNFGAVGFSNKDHSLPTNESHWTNVNEPGLSDYEKSKLLAELAAWDFVKNASGSLEFATVNPVAILGPSLGSRVSESFGVVKHLLDGSMKAVPPIPLNVVDVRDVVDIHIRALLKPYADGHRFIAAADGQITLPEIANLLRREMPEISSRVSEKTLPAWVISIASLFNTEAKFGKLIMKINHHVSTESARKILGWTPMSTQEQAILAAAESLIRHKLVHQD